MHAQINICWRHTLPKDQVLAGIDRVAAELGKEYGAKSTRRGDTVHFSCTSGLSQGVSGSIGVSAGVVRAVVELPFALRVISERIRNGIEEVLEKELGGSRC